MKIVTRELLQLVTEEARTVPRLRKNHNLHPANESRCHRLLNAIEPASYIRPHRHLDPEKDEGFIVLRGRLGIIIFSDEGEVTETALLSHDGDNLAADVPHGVFHTAVSLESGTLFYEAKAGPYLPLTESETASWAPHECDVAAMVYLDQLRNIFVA
jgi:cupin fold WbuC family metalloprotein